MNKYADYPSLRLYDSLRVPYTLTSDTWNGPLWTGHQMILSTREGYGDPGFFHELIHWVVATESQRRFPDMQLGRQVNGTVELHATNITPADVPTNTAEIAHPDGTRNRGWGEQPVKMSTAHRQEEMACELLLFYSPVVCGEWSADLADTVAYYDFGGDYSEWSLTPKHLDVLAHFGKFSKTKLSRFKAEIEA